MGRAYDRRSSLGSVLLNLLERKAKGAEAESGEEILGIAQRDEDFLLNLLRQGIQFSGPCMLATGTRHHQNGQALDEQPTAVVAAFGTLNRQRSIRVRHSRPRCKGRAERKS